MENCKDTHIVYAIQKHLTSKKGRIIMVKDTI